MAINDLESPRGDIIFYLGGVYRSFGAAREAYLDLHEERILRHAAPDNFLVDAASGLETVVEKLDALERQVSNDPSTPHQAPALKFLGSLRRMAVTMRDATVRWYETARAAPKLPPPGGYKHAADMARTMQLEVRDKLAGPLRDNLC